MEDMQIEDQSEDVVATSNPPIVNGDNGQKNGEPEYVFSGKVVQITNVSTGATLQQLATLFGFLGTVTDIRMYPTDESQQVSVKLCYIKYESSEQCGVAQHLTNTVFIDKPLIVVPMNRQEIPEESECRNLIKTINAYASTATTGYLPQYFPPDESAGIQGLPPPPIITSTTDPVEIEEIKKTIFVENIPECITSEQMMAFFSGVGEIKYLRFVKGERKYCFIEFSNLESVPTALQYNGVLFGGKCLKVQYSKCPIIKPESERIASGRGNVRKSTRDVVKRPSSAERDTWDRQRVFTSRSRSRSRSKSRRRSRSRERRFRRSRSRSRSPRRRKSRSRSPSKNRRKRSLRRSRSRSIGKSLRRRSRSRSKSKSPRRRRSRSRSRERRRRSKRSPSKSPSRSPRRRKKKSKSKSRSPTPHKKKSSRRSISRSPDRSSKKKKKDKDKDKEREKEKSKKDKTKDKDVEEKELKNLLTKIYTFEEEKEKGKKDKKIEEVTVKKDKE